MEYICGLLPDWLTNDTDFQKDLIIALISVLMVIITNCITLLINNRNIKLSKQQFEKTLEEQKKQFDEQINVQKRIFEETIKRDNFRDRVSIMPYFELDENVKIIDRAGEIEFPLHFTNIGNGTAVRTHIDIHNRIAYEDSSFDIKYYQCKQMSSGIVKCDKSTETMLEAEYRNGAYEVIISLCYEDMMQRQYEQKFSFYYEYNRGDDILVQKHFAPKCIKDNL